ncbi:hypothetical protein TWF730_007969 [Orbilia blumenaviensis]|uniref:GDP/GTP exchange factor Sec2 N-terminal domain-containing protein n=1 Tax=Orbilia blumenaviensis TaxID=1796055 RepID=A0AAV9VBZ3_9PEZI
MASTTSRPRSRTFTTPDPTKRRSLPAEYDGYVSQESGNDGTTEPAAAYISTRLSPPDSPLPDHHYDNYKEQRLYNFVMSTSTSLSPASARPANHSRGNSISSENGNFFTNLFTTTSASSPASPQSGVAPSHSRTNSLSAPQGATSAGRKISHFFGLGVVNDTASNSGLAFSSAPSSHRSVSNSTTLSNLVLPERTGARGAQTLNENLMIRDEFAGTDFAELLNAGVPKSPLNCTPQGFNALHSQSMELIERLYAGYLERTRALADALAEIDALRDDLEQKDQKIESLKFSCEQLANVQEALSKASEEAEKTATKANAEVKKLRAENERLEWEAKSIREIEMDDASSISSSAPKYGLGLRPKDVPQGLVRSRTKSSNSDSGFESESDSGSVFSNDSKMAVSGISSPGPTFTADDEVETPSTGSGPLAQLRNVLRRTATVVDAGKCDCNGTIGRLRSENNQLVVRVKELEGCLDSCLDLVGSI